MRTRRILSEMENRTELPAVIEELYGGQEPNRFSARGDVIPTIFLQV
tara:strand:- start:257 stop:397 length:141 start_codon:yes stop_codon:yes gene_type:complete